MNPTIRILDGSMMLSIYIKYFGCLIAQSITTFTFSRWWYLRESQFSVAHQKTTKMLAQKKLSFKLLYLQNLLRLRIMVDAIKVHHQVCNHNDYNHCNPWDHHLNRLFIFTFFEKIEIILSLIIWKWKNN